MKKVENATVELYIEHCSEEDRVVLNKIRQTIKKAVPAEAKEVISYQMPAFRLNRVFIFYAAFNQHYSLFIPPSHIYEEYKEELSKYKIHKATIQFQKSEPVPYDLIAELARAAANEDLKPAAESNGGIVGY